MNIEEFVDYCIKKEGVTEEFPFDESTLVMKVYGKVFALTGLDGAFSINLKCEPERAIELREEYSAILPGFHMNKKHWNTVHVDGTISDKMLCELIDHSYQLVYSKLPKKLRS